MKPLKRSYYRPHQCEACHLRGDLNLVSSHSSEQPKRGEISGVSCHSEQPKRGEISGGMMQGTHSFHNCEQDYRPRQPSKSRSHCPVGFYTVTRSLEHLTLQSAHKRGKRRGK